jgi:hypothetical protein
MLAADPGVDKFEKKGLWIVHVGRISQQRRRRKPARRLAK